MFMNDSMYTSHYRKEVLHSRDSGITLCCVTLMCTDVDSLCDAHYYSAMHSLHAESEISDISMVGMIVCTYPIYVAQLNSPCKPYRNIVEDITIKHACCVYLLATYFS